VRPGFDSTFSTSTARDQINQVVGRPPMG
jgi:hypothetical protein